jgi:hypothetical protein
LSVVANLVIPDHDAGNPTLTSCSVSFRGF